MKERTAYIILFLISLIIAVIAGVFDLPIWINIVVIFLAGVWFSWFIGKKR